MSSARALPPPLLTEQECLEELRAQGHVGNAAGITENQITALLRRTVIALRLTDAVAQNELVAGLLGGAAAVVGRPVGSGRLPVPGPSFCPDVGNADAPDLVLTDAHRGGRATVVVEHKPAGSRAQFSRASHVCGPSAQLFADTVSQRYCDGEHRREWVYRVPPGEVVHEGCFRAHRSGPDGDDRCEYGVLMRTEHGKLHDDRDGRDRLYLAVPQIDVYRCSRAWVDRHAERQPDSAFTLDDPTQVAWIFLTGYPEGVSLAGLYRGWAHTADEWTVVRYTDFAATLSAAYAAAWTRATLVPAAVPHDGLRQLHVLTSIIANRC